MKQPIAMLNLKRLYQAYRSEIDAALSSCLTHQHWIFGPEVQKLEGAIAEYLNVKHCIGCSSGTESLVLALRALTLKKTGKEFFSEEDLIVTTPFTFTATGDSILRSGATPLFVDIDPESYAINLNSLKQALISHKNIRGIIPVSLYGLGIELDQLAALCREHGIFMIEDCAQSFGAQWKGQRVGTFGDFGSYSFFPSKNLGCFGDGGMLSCADSELDELVRMLIKHGGKDKYNVEHIGYNARLDTIQAAVLLSRLTHIDDWNNRRRQVALRYREGLKDLPTLGLPTAPPDALHVFHQFTLRVPAQLRSGLMESLKNEGIDSMVYYPVPLHQMRVFEGRSRKHGELFEAERVASEVLSLPMDPLLEEHEIDRVISQIHKYIKS